MNIILLLIPLSIIMLVLGVSAFFWAVNHAQFDDLDTPAMIPLTADEPDTQAEARTVAEHAPDDVGP